MLTDPVADILTHIHNANKALHATTEMPNSKLKQEIARILKEGQEVSMPTPLLTCAVATAPESMKRKMLAGFGARLSVLRQGRGLERRGRRRCSR